MSHATNNGKAPSVGALHELLAHVERWLWRLVRRIFKKSPRFKVGQVVKRTLEPETCWRPIVEIYDQYQDADRCECCGQKTPGRWITEYVFDLGEGYRGCLGIEWDSQMHAKPNKANEPTTG